MRLRRFVQVVDTHTAGEPTRIATGGLPTIPGANMAERRRWLDTAGVDLCRFLLDEPRGHRNMFGAVLTPPCDPSADFGVVFLDNNGTLSMCGHGTIGVVTALVTLALTEKETILLDTPAGIVRCHLQRADGEIVSVTFQNVPGFYLQAYDYNGVQVHLAYGGNLFALVDVRSVGLRVSRTLLPKLIDKGMEIRAWLNECVDVHHPGTGIPMTADLVEFYEEGDPDRNVVIFGDRQVDRSPCGTGTCAKMAFLHATGRLETDTDYRYHSILGTEFVGRVLAETKVGDIDGIVPQVTGAAYVTGIGSLVLLEDDPFPAGFVLEGECG